MEVKINNDKEKIYTLANRHIVPVCSGGSMLNINLADFPHGELTHTRKDDMYDIEFYSVPYNVTVPACNELNGTVAMAKVKSWSVHRGKCVEIVTLSDGRQLVTDDDPRAVYGISLDGACTFERCTPTEALNKGMFVPVCKSSVLEELYTDNSRYSHIDLDTGMLLYENDTKASREAGHLVCKLDFDFGQFIGCMAGDGWWDHVDRSESAYYSTYGYKKALFIADNEGDNAEFIISYLRSILTQPIDVQIKKFSKDEYAGRLGDTTRYSLFGKNMDTVAEFLDFALDGHGDEDTSGAKNKRIPSWICNVPQEVKWGVLAGLISTDGSISISKHENDKKKRAEQLLVTIFSTSLNMLLDAKAMLFSMGLSCNIGFSKVTAAGNNAWVLTVHTPTLKERQANLSKMACARKYKVLQDAVVAVESASEKTTSKVCVPESVKLLLKSGIGQKQKEYDTLNRKLVGGYFSKGNGLVTRATALQAISIIESDVPYVADEVSDVIEKVRSILTTAANSGVYSNDSNEAVKSLLATYYSRSALRNIPGGQKAISDLKVTLNRYCRNGKLASGAIDNTISVLETYSPANALVAHNQLYKRWRDIVVNGSFNWAKVVKVDKTDEPYTGYDLTVPGYETFMSPDGVIMSNTINVHVPSTDEAVKETYETMLPSRHPYADRSGESIISKLKQEQLLGMYATSMKPTNGTYKFKTRDEALNAVKKGDIPLDAELDIEEDFNK